MSTIQKGAALTMALVAVTAVQISAASAAPETAPTPKVANDRVVRGEFLVRMGLCDDCHTTKKMGPNGPELDLSRRLAGHPQEMVMPPAPVLPAGPWAATASGTMTAWSGPWGLSFTQNLTPDPETGLGKWSEEEFVAALQTGRHQGRGRPILPPMPWPAFSTLPEEDLRAIWAYLRTIPPVHNKVPDPVAPSEPGVAAAK